MRNDLEVHGNVVPVAVQALVYLPGLLRGRGRAKRGPKTTLACDSSVGSWVCFVNACIQFVNACIQVDEK